MSTLATSTWRLAAPRPSLVRAGDLRQRRHLLGHAPAAQAPADRPAPNRRPRARRRPGSARAQAAACARHFVPAVVQAQQHRAASRSRASASRRRRRAGRSTVATWPPSARCRSARPSERKNSSVVPRQWSRCLQRMTAPACTLIHAARASAQHDATARSRRGAIYWGVGVGRANCAAGSDSSRGRNSNQARAWTVQRSAECRPQRAMAACVISASCVDGLQRRTAASVRHSAAARQVT